MAEKHIILNALASTQLSGKHVLLGHLHQLAQQTAHQYTVLYHTTNQDMVTESGPRVHWKACPPETAHWWKRALWERNQLGGLLKQLDASVLFMNSGTVVPNLEIPQISLALNPWSMVREAQSTMKERAKASLQRYAYRQAVNQADGMLYCSNFLRSLYEKNAGKAARRSGIAYCGMDDDAVEASKAPVDRQTRVPGRILCLARMIPHKRIDRLIDALPGLAEPAHLRLVGSWSDEGYRESIEHRAEQLGVSHRVEITGHVKRQDLFSEYAQAQVYALMSDCESFGIPIIEAQSFGTPVVCANKAAMPEVGGAGGLFPEADDTEGCVKSLHRLLNEPDTWEEFSKAARDNAQRFTYEQTSKSVITMIDQVLS